LTRSGAATESRDYVRVAFHYEREEGDVQHIAFLAPRSDANAYVPGSEAWVEHREFGVRAWVTIDSDGGQSPDSDRKRGHLECSQGDERS